MVTVLGHGDGGGDGVQEILLVNAGEDEARLIQRLGALGAGADAHSREGLADAGKEAALLGQRAAVRHHRKGVHLQAVVIVEAKRLVTNNAAVELKSALFKSVSAARMAGIKDRHIVLFGDSVDRVKERVKVLFGIYILFAMGAQQNILAC